MERELWPRLYRTVQEVGRQVRQKGVSYQPWVVAAVILWACLHDRPRCWACQERNWSTTLHRPIRLPSASVLSRRADTVGMGLFWRQLEIQLRGTGSGGLFSRVDGKPLFVGGCSKDPDVCWGYGAGMHGKGYKLHAIWSAHAFPETWEVTPLNQSEAVVAARMVAQLDRGGYLLADGNYDTNPLHTAAGLRGYQLLCKNRRPNSGRGHRPQTPWRLRGLQLRQTTFGHNLLTQRIQIERDFAHATYFAGGLSPLPGWVRRQHRVRTWVWAKLAINATRILTRIPQQHPLTT